MSEPKLIHNKIRQNTNRRELNEKFNDLLTSAISYYEENKDVHFRKYARFAKELNNFAREKYSINLQFSEKDIQRLKYPQKQEHTKHGLEIIRCLREYIKDKEAIDNDIPNQAFIEKSFNTISSLKRIVDYLEYGGDAPVEINSYGLIEREAARINYFVISIKEYNHC